MDEEDKKRIRLKQNKNLILKKATSGSISDIQKFDFDVQNVRGKKEKLESRIKNRISLTFPVIFPFPVKAIFSFDIC